MAREQEHSDAAHVRHGDYTAKWSVRTFRNAVYRLRRSDSPLKRCQSMVMAAPEERRYRVRLSCDGVPPTKAEQAAIDIAEEFTHRRWHQNVECHWEAASLILVAENDFDPDGLALCDEFSDAISACISGGFDGQIRVVSVVEIPSGR